MILVTGGAGFIGSNLVAALDARGERVAVCDRLGQGDKWLNLAKRDLEAVIAPEQLSTFLDSHEGSIEAIFHMGAISTTTEKDVDLVLDTNFRMSAMLWEWCKEFHVQFIYASSAATYGDGSAGFRDDESPEALSRLHPLNPYGWSKHLFDRWVVRRKARDHDGPSQCVGLKFFNVYGPNEYHKSGQRSVAHQIYPHAKKGDSFSLFKSYSPQYSDGGQMRDFVWVGDCIRVMVWMLENPKVNGLFNLGTGKARSFNDLARAVYQAVGKEAKIKYKDMPEELREKYQNFTEADMSKLRGAGYTAPFTELEEGIKLYVQNYLDAKDPHV
ncbi:MAG: ADP-glyceromanno-heptose 6-epimerase [Alphaproteobacteria bacterium]|nr:ADP-glyceromanno-heptose 6-epimerase [Alphaproteobacteria bacterium]